MYGYAAISGRALVSCANKLLFPDIRRTDQYDLSRTLSRHSMAQSRLLRPRFSPFEFLPELANLLLEVRLELLRPFVLGEQTKQLAECFEPLLRCGRFAILVLNLEVLRGKVGRHRGRSPRRTKSNHWHRSDFRPTMQESGVKPFSPAGTECMFRERILRFRHFTSPRG